MFGPGGIQDEMLKAYVDKVFDKYDADKSGALDQHEMTNFFNDLFKQLGVNKQVKVQQSLQAIKTIDKNFDGSVDKDELFLAFKQMLIKSQQQNMQQSRPPAPYAPPPYAGYGGYGANWGGYGGYGGYANYGGYNNPYGPNGYYPPPPPPQAYGYPPSPYYPPNPNMNPMGQSQPPPMSPPMYGGYYAPPNNNMNGSNGSN